MNDPSFSSPTSMYTDLLQTYLNPSGASSPLVADGNEDDVFDLPNEFHLDDSVVAECAAYWAPHYLHKDGTLSPELVEIITNLNVESVEHSKPSTIQSANHSVSDCNTQCPAVACPDAVVADGVVSNGPAGRTAKGTCRRRKTAKHMPRCGKRKGAAPAENTHSVAAADPETQGRDTELNEEEKSRLVEQLVQLIKYETRELEEFKAGGLNHVLCASKACATAGPATLEPRCRVPPGWERIHVDDPLSVIYISPSGEIISNMSMLRAYLLRSDTCKCGIECPINLAKVFNFDRHVTSCFTSAVNCERRHACTCLLANGSLPCDVPPAVLVTTGLRRSRGRPRKSTDDRPPAPKAPIADRPCGKAAALSKGLLPGPKPKRSTQRKRKKPKDSMPEGQACAQQWDIATQPQVTRPLAAGQEPAVRPDKLAAVFQGEAAAIRQLFSLVTSSHNIQSVNGGCSSNGDLVKEFDPDPDLFNKLYNPEIHAFAKHVIFTRPSNDTNSFSFDTEKPMKSRSRRNPSGKTGTARKPKCKRVASNSGPLGTHGKSVDQTFIYSDAITGQFKTPASLPTVPTAVDSPSTFQPQAGSPINPSNLKSRLLLGGIWLDESVNNKQLQQRKDATQHQGQLSNGCDLTHKL